MSASFLDFCRTAQLASDTRSRLEKARVLGDFFSGLSDGDLRCAALYLGGSLFPLREGRVISVGNAQIRAALLQTTQVDENHLAPRLIEHGDWGDVAFEVFTQKKRDTSHRGFLCGKSKPISRFWQQLAAHAKSWRSWCKL